MAIGDAFEKKPLWLLIEENILALDAKDLSGGNLEPSIQRMAIELDNAGFNVSRHGGNLLKLRWAVDKAKKVGRPLLKDFDTAIAAFSLEDLADPYKATSKLLDDIAGTWPELRDPEVRPDVVQIVEKTKRDLLIAKAKSLTDDDGIRLLIKEKVASRVITAELGISEDKLEQVRAEIKRELAERERVATLLEAVADKSDEEKVRHLFEKNVSVALIVEMAKVDQGVIEAAKRAMEEELKEKQRLEEEEAARKKAAAAGPALEDIPADELLGYIESIREIMEFSEEEREIRIMCEQSSVPKSLVDMAISEPEKLDELEKKAEG